jgi:hypothetical protein
VNELDRRFAAENLAGYDGFAEFVVHWLNEENIWSSVHFRPQHYFICDANFCPRVDFIGRTETIDADFRFICERLGVTADLKWNNRSNHRLYYEYYTDDLRERVAAVYADDIAVFDYKFEPHLFRPALSPRTITEPS